MATKENPRYGVYLFASDGTQYNLTDCVEEIRATDQAKQFAKTLTLSLVNVQVKGKWLNSIIQNRDRIFLYANDGERNDEVWRGFVWSHGYKSSTSVRQIVLKCYDNLIYCQESEESEFFAAGKSTKDIMSSICNKWGIPLEYTYDSITHSKLALRGALSDIIISDILEAVRKQTGKKYVVLSEQDIMKIKPVGSNDVVYKIMSKNNAITTEATRSMDGMITKVVILGKADDNERRPVEATVSGDTKKYGTLQKLINRDEDTKLEEAKKEGNTLIKENGEPKWEYRVEAVDIPWLRKGDKVYVSAGSLIGHYIVTGIDRTIAMQNKIMSVTMEDM